MTAHELPLPNYSYSNLPPTSGYIAVPPSIDQTVATTRLSRLQTSVNYDW